MARGKHTITRIETGNPPGLSGSAQRSQGRYWGIALLVILALLAFLFSGCSKKEETAFDPVATPAPRATEVASPPEQAPSAPARPSPPRAKVAVVQSADSVSGAEPLSVVLGGGDYDITYETVDSFPDQATLGTDKVFVADYEQNSTRGDPRSADVYVLIGSLKLQIGDISESDLLYTSILSRGSNVNAYFNFATSERGPPNEKRHRRIIVVGELEYIGLPDRYDTSKNAIQQLELDPSEDSQQEYQVALAKYEADMREYRTAMDAWRAREATGNGTLMTRGEDDVLFRPPESRPAQPEYHPPSTYHPPPYHPPPRARP